MKAINPLYVFAMVIVLTSVSANSVAQIQAVTLQAGGLTCSMCSRSIYKSLQKVPNIAKVEEDIEHSSYHIQFANPESVSLVALKKAIIDAGFSVVRMEVMIGFEHAVIANDSTLKYEDLIFHFVNVSRQTLNGNRTVLIVDKNYLLEKDRKKYPGSYEAGPNIFHVTLPQS